MKGRVGESGPSELLREELAFISRRTIYRTIRVNKWREVRITVVIEDFWG